jgi:phosphatidylserine/phosphatidylglycerophosphate/cardiolipin synthase-like enzyme
MRLRALVMLLLATFVASCESDPGVEVESVFCKPNPGQCSERLVSLIDGARDTVQCAVYSFTLDHVAEALVDAVERGVQVWVVYEKQQEDVVITGALSSGGVFIRSDGNSKAMHHKFIVVDGEVVADGSFNWTNNADYDNDENLLVIHSADLAGDFADEFVRIWNEAQ